MIRSVRLSRAGRGHAVLGLVVLHRGLDRVFGEDRAVDLHRRECQFLGDLGVADAAGLVEGGVGGQAGEVARAAGGEFAEDLPTIKVLCEAGIDFAQGYGISKPVTGDLILSAQSGADFVQDPEILAFLQELQSQDDRNLNLFSDSAFSTIR